MTAVITDRLKKQLLVDTYRDFQDSDVYYYAGIGRSEDWNASDTPLTPSNTLRDDRNLRVGLQSVKNITDISFVVPRVNWSSGTVYSAYSDNQSGYPANAYYVMNDNQQVYVCLEQGKDNSNPVEANRSTVQPTGNTTGTPFKTADGYVWKFLYSIGALKASKFISSAFIPVQKVQDSAGATLLLDEVGVDSDSPAEDVEQQLVQQAAIGGQITGYRVITNGSGYTSTPTVVIQGDGDSAQGVATVVGGQVTKVEILEDSAGAPVPNRLYFGSGYTYANVILSGGGADSAAEVIPVVSSLKGLGADPREDLKSSAIMFNTKPNGTEEGDFIVGQDFRQIGLFRNLELADSSALFTQATSRTLDKLELSAVTSGPFLIDQVIKGQTSQAQAYIDDVSEDSDLIWIHQTEYTGFLSFDSGETIEIVEGGGSTTATIDKILPSVIDRHSGDLLYIDNRAPVIRSSDQTEDIKIVIQL